MGSTDITLVLLLGFGLGMLHALDADHVMAVSGLASSRSTPRSALRNSLRFCLRWALGHGLVLFFIACAVYLFGMSIPPGLSEIAESLVGGVLILIGLMVVRDLIRQNAHLHFHRHGHTPLHAHWHVHERIHDGFEPPGSNKLHQHGRNPDQYRDQHRDHRHDHHHDHSAVLVGMLHGIAGSAPLLALIPVAQQKSPLLGILYVLLFSLGVILSMLLFGGMLGMAFSRLEQLGYRFVYSLRATVAAAAIVFGSLLLKSSFI